MSSSSSSPSSGGGGGSPSSPQTYERYAIQGMKLGMPLEQQAGYTCGPPRGTDGFSTADPTCVKFLDDRCKDRPTTIHHIRSSGDVPRASCFMDEATGGTYLDGDLLKPPLFAVRLVGSDSNHPLVYQIVYTFPADDLTTTSKLGKALIDKYGTPTSTAEPVKMVWEAGDVQLRAECRMIQGGFAKTGDFCTLSIEDRTLAARERDRQAEADAAGREASAPAPPSL